MLRATFQSLIRGVGAAQETRLWREGVLTWEEYGRGSGRQQELFDESTSLPPQLADAKAALDRCDADFFARRLNPREHFRIPLEFPAKTLFLDIETTGLSRYYDIITVIGWSNQDGFHSWVRGTDPQPLLAALAEAAAVVTFNGSMFDLPFIRHEFSDIQIPSVHIDLRFLAKRIDLSGGQKHIESILGFKRPKSLANMAGENAPVLWHQYRRGDDAAMRLLLQYNHADIEGMKWIFDHVTRELLKRSGLPATRARTAPRFFSRREFFTESRRIANDTQGVQSYRGRVGPSVLLSQLDTDHFGTPLRVVGIDLTGSQTKPSGWCALAGGEVETRTIASDDDLVAQTLAVNPHIISIDSPLSLPRGRISVSDDDPGRVEFGIMRQSERALKKRGVNVYPALIPSMQKLTARGIRLAARFRALGFPTIESYPGAAQDIMGIPRKRSSLTMLRSGLAEFGLSGSFLAREVSHDELDAITSAVVGAFFWSGQFESLGEEAEEALIIPDLSPKDSAQKRIVIGISGRIAAGKTTAAKLLGEEDFAYGRYSMVVESMLGESDKTGGRDILQKRGMELHRDHGQRWLGRQLLALLPKSGHLVIDGLRFPDDHAFLVETFGHSFLHLHLEAPEQLRRLRYDQRAGKSGDFFRAEAHPVEGAIDKLRELAHCVLRNDQGIDALHAQIKAKIQSSVR